MARREWDLAEIYFIQEAEICLCGHTLVKEVCVLRNRLNGHTARVGNVCVKRFLGLPSEQIFLSLRKIKQSCESGLNEAAIEYAFSHGWLTSWERKFSLDTQRRRVLTEKQLAKRKSINRKVLLRVITSI